jgi:transposase
MTIPPVGISEADWLATPAGVRALILSQQQEILVLNQAIDQLRQQLTSQATELINLNSGSAAPLATPPNRLPVTGLGSSPPPARRNGSDLKRDGQQGHPGSGPELLPVKRCNFTNHHPEACRRWSTYLQGDDP